MSSVLARQNHHVEVCGSAKPLCSSLHGKQQAASQFPLRAGNPPTRPCLLKLLQPANKTQSPRAARTCNTEITREPRLVHRSVWVLLLQVSTEDHTFWTKESSVFVSHLFEVTLCAIVLLHREW